MQEYEQHTEAEVLYPALGWSVSGGNDSAENQRKNIKSSCSWNTRQQGIMALRADRVLFIGWWKCSLQGEQSFFGQWPHICICLFVQQQCFYVTFILNIRLWAKAKQALKGIVHPKIWIPFFSGTQKEQFKAFLYNESEWWPVAVKQDFQWIPT